MPKRKSLDDVRNGSNEKCTWTPFMEDFLVDSYVLQHNLGNRQGGTFSSTAIDNILRDMKNRFPEKQLEKAKIKDHMKRLKKKFMSCYDLFKNGLTDFAWDPKLNMWLAEPEAWEKLIEAKPKAAIWRYKPIPYYDQMLTLYGHQVRPTGEYSETAFEMCHRNAPESETHILPQIDEQLLNDELKIQRFRDESNGSSQTHKSEGESVSEGVSLPKNKKKKVTEATNDTGVLILAKSVDNMVDAFMKCTANLAKCHQRSPMVANEIWKLVESLGLDESMVVKAYCFLVRDIDAQRVLLGCPPEKRKEILLYVMST